MNEVEKKVHKLLFEDPRSIWIRNGPGGVQLDKDGKVLKFSQSSIHGPRKGLVFAAEHHDGQRELEHLPVLGQLDPSRPVANPNGSEVFKEKLVHFFLHFIHVARTSGLVEALCANPAVDHLHLLCGQEASPKNN